MIELVYLNPNITREEADKLAKDVNDKRKKLYNTLFDNVAKLKTDKAKADYLSVCLPIIAML